VAAMMKKVDAAATETTAPSPRCTAAESRGGTGRVCGEHALASRASVAPLPSSDNGARARARRGVGARRPTGSRGVHRPRSQGRRRVARARAPRRAWLAARLSAVGGCQEGVSRTRPGRANCQVEGHSRKVEHTAPARRIVTAQWIYAKWTNKVLASIVYQTFNLKMDIF